MTIRNLIEVIPTPDPCSLGQAAWTPASDATACAPAEAPTLLQFMHPDAITVPPVLLILVLLALAVIVLAEQSSRINSSR